MECFAVGNIAFLPPASRTDWRLGSTANSTRPEHRHPGCRPLRFERGGYRALRSEQIKKAELKAAKASALRRLMAGLAAMLFVGAGIAALFGLKAERFALKAERALLDEHEQRKRAEAKEREAAESEARAKESDALALLKSAEAKASLMQAKKNAEIAVANQIKASESEKCAKLAETKAKLAAEESEKQRVLAIRNEKRANLSNAELEENLKRSATVRKLLVIFLKAHPDLLKQPNEKLDQMFFKEYSREIEKIYPNHVVVFYEKGGTRKGTVPEIKSELKNVNGIATPYTYTVNVEREITYSIWSPDSSTNRRILSPAPELLVLQEAVQS